VSRRPDLAVSLDVIGGDCSLVPADSTMRIIEKLLAEGFTKQELARRLGSTAKVPALQLRRDRVTARNRHKVEQLARELLA